eukprot:279634_1
MSENLSINIPSIVSPHDEPVDDGDQAVVIDNGSATIKAGFAGDDAPRVDFPTVIGRPISNFNAIECHIGDKAINNKHKLSLSYPIEHGIITNWDDIEQIWSNTFSNKLKINSEQHAVLTADPPLNPKANREKATQIMFESFNVPQYYTGTQQVLSLYASGRTTGIVLDAGYNIYIVPIYEGYAEPHATLRQDIGGKDVTQYLKKLILKNNNQSSLDIKFDDFRKMKEQYAYVAENGVENELRKPMCDPTCIISGYLREIHSGFTSVDIENICNQYFGESNKYIRCKNKYKLPDGKVIKFSDEMFNCTEIFFNPKLIEQDDMEGIDRLLFSSIMKLDVSLRKDMYFNVILSGGTSLLPAFGTRIKNKIKTLAPDSMTIKVSVPAECKYSAWIGGSILCSLSTFQEMWITKQEYDECGPSIVHEKCT